MFLTRIFILLIFFSSIIIVYAACPYQNNTLLPWFSASSWPGGLLPASGSDVIVPAGQGLLYNPTSAMVYNSVTVPSSATVVFADVPSQLNVSWIFVAGTVIMGSASCPLTSKIVVTFTGVRVNASVNPLGDNFGSKGLLVNGGTFEVHGTPPSHTWTRLAASAHPGDTTIKVQDDVADWKAGAQIVLASTDYDATQSERLFLAKDVVPGSATIYLTTPVTYLHMGGTRSIASGALVPDEAAEVGLLTRNIVFQGDDHSIVDSYGCHLSVAYPASTGRFDSVEVRLAGQRGILGKYPIHFHMMTTPLQPTQYATRCAIHDTFQRAITVHNSNGILIENNVAYNTTGHMYFMEEGAEELNVYNHNLGILTQPGPMIPTDVDASIFWITNPNNTWTNNAAVGGFFGYWFSMPFSPIGSSAYRTDLQPRSIPLLLFTDNTVHSTQSNGLMVDVGVQADGTAPDDSSYFPRAIPPGTAVTPSTDLSVFPKVTATFTRVFAYKCRNRGIWTRGGPFSITEARLMDNLVGVLTPGGPSIVQNSVIIGETENIGTWPVKQSLLWGNRSRPLTYNPSYPIFGMQWYDCCGPVFVRNVTFGGFLFNSIRPASVYSTIVNGIGVLPPWPQIHGVKYLDASNLFFRPNQSGVLHDGYNGVSFLDADGTATGGVGNWISGNTSALLYPGCTATTVGGNGYVCPPHAGTYLQLYVQNTNLAATNLGNSTAQYYHATFYPFGVNAVDGGLSVTGLGPDDNLTVVTTYTMHAISRRGYLLRFPHPTPPQMSIYLAENAAIGDWVVVAFDNYPADTKFVVRQGWGTGTLLTPVSSIDLVDDWHYYFNASAGILYVLIRQNDAGSQLSYFGITYYGGTYPYSITASCGSSCTRNADLFIPASFSLAPDEDVYTFSTSSSDLFGFLSFDPAKTTLVYSIFFAAKYQSNATIQLSSNGLILKTLNTLTSPARGQIVLSRLHHFELWTGKFSAQISSPSASSSTASVTCCGTCETPMAQSKSSLTNPATSPCVVYYNASQQLNHQVSATAPLQPPSGVYIIYSKSLLAASWNMWNWDRSHTQFLPHFPIGLLPSLTTSSLPALQGSSVLASSVPVLSPSVCGATYVVALINNGTGDTFALRTSDSTTNPFYLVSSSGIPYYSYLQFYVRSVNGPITLTVNSINNASVTFRTSDYLVPPSTQHNTQGISNYIVDNAVWSRVRIPLFTADGLNITSPFRVTEFWLKFLQPDTVVFDEILLTNDPDPEEDVPVTVSEGGSFSAVRNTISGSAICAKAVAVSPGASPGSTPNAPGSTAGTTAGGLTTAAFVGIIGGAMLLIAGVTFGAVVYLRRRGSMSIRAAGQMEERTIGSTTMRRQEGPNQFAVQFSDTSVHQFH